MGVQRVLEGRREGRTGTRESSIMTGNLIVKGWEIKRRKGVGQKRQGREGKRERDERDKGRGEGKEEGTKKRERVGRDGGKKGWD